MARPHGSGVDGGEADGEFLQESNQKTHRDAVLIAIDMSESMLTRPTAGTGDERGGEKQRDLAPAVAALQSAYELMKQRIISNPKDKIGIVLFGTSVTRSVRPDDRPADQFLDGASFPGCYVLVDLDVPAATDVKMVGDLIDCAVRRAHGEGVGGDGDGDGDFGRLLEPGRGESAKGQIGTMFLCANQLFSTRAAAFLSKRMFVITDNDRPEGADKDAAAAAVVWARDLYDSNVMVDLFPVGTFDRTVFYDDIAYCVDSDNQVDGIGLLDRLRQTITSRVQNKRAILNGTLQLGPGLELSVRLFAMIKRQEPVRSCYVWLHGEQARLAESHTTRIADDTGRTIESTDEIQRAFRFGGASVPFSSDEMEKLRGCGSRTESDDGHSVIRVVAFKPVECLPAWARVRPATFVYPSEHAFAGSTRVFASLFQSLRTKRKMAIAWCRLRRNAGPVLAALVPTIEATDESTKSDQLADGLFLIPLPFTDDLRQVPNSVSQVVQSASLPTTSSGLADLAAVEPLKDVIGSLMLPHRKYLPSRFSNPALQHFYSILRALALDEDVPAPGRDNTEARVRQIDRRVGIHLKACADLIARDAGSIQLASLKREAGSPAANDRKKTRPMIASSAASGPILTDKEMRGKVEDGSISKCTVAMLKSWVSTKPELMAQAAVTQRKSDWIDLVSRYF